MFLEVNELKWWYKWNGDSFLRVTLRVIFLSQNERISIWDYQGNSYSCEYINRCCIDIQTTEQTNVTLIIFITLDYHVVHFWNILKSEVLSFAEIPLLLLVYTFIFKIGLFKDYIVSKIKRDAQKK